MNREIFHGIPAEGPMTALRRCLRRRRQACRPLSPPDSCLGHYQTSSPNPCEMCQLRACMPSGNPPIGNYCSSREILEAMLAQVPKFMPNEDRDFVTAEERESDDSRHVIPGQAQPAAAEDPMTPLDQRIRKRREAYSPQSSRELLEAMHVKVLHCIDEDSDFDTAEEGESDDWSHQNQSPFKRKTLKRCLKVPVVLKNASTSTSSKLGEFYQENVAHLSCPKCKHCLQIQQKCVVEVPKCTSTSKCFKCGLHLHVDVCPIHIDAETSPTSCKKCDGNEKDFSGEY